MQCKLCDSPIKDFEPRFNKLALDDEHTVYLCQDCIEKMMRWQQDIFASLFPTKSAKRWAKKGKKEN